jgi:hypothetical protein
MNVEAPAHEIIARAVRASTPWFLDVDLRARTEGWVAFVRLNPTMAKVRATEQGLRDKSLATAANDEQVRRMWDWYIARANKQLPPDHQIVAYTPVFDEPAGDG